MHRGAAAYHTRLNLRQFRAALLWVHNALDQASSSRYCPAFLQALTGRFFQPGDGVMMPRALLLALLAACAGCIPFVPCYYAYPSISYVPIVDTECGTDVSAFRVDVAEKHNGIEYF